jgi:hypothetical protein
MTMGYAVIVIDPARHEPLTQRAWDAARARVAIAEIVARTESAFHDDALWPAHPLDLEDGPLPQVKSLYLGAAGVIWALHELARAKAAQLQRDWSAIATSLADAYRAAPDFPEEVAGPEPALWMGEAGILLVAHTLAPAPWQEHRLLAAVHANTHPGWDLMWGCPGTMVAAQVMFERTGDPRWSAAWQAAANRLWSEWRDELWLHEIDGHRQHAFGPAHGFAGCVYALARGDLLDPARRTTLEQRAIATLARHARRADGLAQWPPTIEPTSQPNRTQWCHGAPGMVASLATLAPTDHTLDELLVAGGELTWRAGPLRRGANLCHGTAGNGYAFLKLFERTGDERWLERARAFAMHAIEQVHAALAEHGRGRHTLWTGDLGTALYLQSCITARAALPTLDWF